MPRHFSVAVWRRALAVVASLASLLAALWIFALALITTSLLRSPDPTSGLDGDPCCEFPDTWAEVALGALWFVALVALGLGLATLAVALGGTAVRGRAPQFMQRHRRRLAMLTLGPILCALAASFVWLVATAL